MHRKDSLQDEAKIIDESSQIFVALCFDKWEDLTCDLYMDIAEKKKKKGNKVVTKSHEYRILN